MFMCAAEASNYAFLCQLICISTPRSGTRNIRTRDDALLTIALTDGTRTCVNVLQPRVPFGRSGDANKEHKH